MSVLGYPLDICVAFPQVVDKHDISVAFQPSTQASCSQRTACCLLHVSPIKWVSLESD